ncbi:MAG: right-handed parallel beta-helix repeat-containing protein [Armatimonadetes bacterium]|nr:right-handed parallel beta-helix repeat-containing protein [Armatimonadota bacterium]
MHARIPIITLAAMLAVTMLSTAVAGDGASESAAGNQRVDAVVFYIATNGNDSWSGKLAAPDAQKADGPFATLTRARDAVRALKEAGSLSKPATVTVRGGKYFLSEAFVLDERDSGTRDCTITWSAYPGEKPILSGGVRVTGWKHYKGSILQTDTPAIDGKKWQFRQLFFNSERQIRARTPNFDTENPLYGGWAFMASRGPKTGEFKYRDGLFKTKLTNPTEAEIYFFVGVIGSWGTDIWPITGIDYDNLIIRTEYKYAEHEHLGFKPDTRFRVENVLEELDQPGEWCQYLGDGKLYFWPPEELNERSEVVAPALSGLFVLSGAQWVTVSGLTFTENLSGEAVRLENTKHVRLVNNHITSAGGHGLTIVESQGKDCQRNVIQYNEIGYAADAGIYCQGRVRFNQILDNEIHHSGHFNKYAAGIVFVPLRSEGSVTQYSFSDGNLIAHNYVHDVPRDGINLGANPYGHNVVEYNRVERACQETVDAAAIRCHLDGIAGLADDLSEIPAMVGHTMRYNLVIDTTGCGVRGGKIVTPNFAFGFFLDDLSANCVLYGNIVVRSGDGFWANAGRNHVFENNIFIDCKQPICYSVPPHLNDPMVFEYVTGNRTARNIFYSRGGDTTAFPIKFHSDAKMFGSADAKRRVVEASDCNLIFKADGKYPGLADWEAIGYEVHSVKADPLFVDAAAGDYRIKSDSPAFDLGFAPVDVSNIGIRM